MLFFQYLCCFDVSLLVSQSVQQTDVFTYEHLHHNYFSYSTAALVMPVGPEVSTTFPKQEHSVVATRLLYQPFAVCFLAAARGATGAGVGADAIAGASVNAVADASAVADSSADAVSSV